MDEHLGQESFSQEPPRRRLGRGLNALMGTGSMGGTDDASTGDQTEISVELIDRNPFQPRQDFDQTALNELVDSIRHYRDHPAEAARLAAAGWRRAHASFAVERLARYIEEATFRQPYSQTYEWLDHVFNPSPAFSPAPRALPCDLLPHSAPPAL